jgi:NADH-quinone oxidoreductase subunit J
VTVELVVFVVAAGVCLAGAVGVVASSNPVHAALSLVATLFGVAVLFVAEEANFLAAVQVIVYAGAIVVLFLFVIMFLGVDRAENLRVEPLGGGQRIAAGFLGAGVVALVLAALADTSGEATGGSSLVGPLASGGEQTDIGVLGEAIFTRYVFAFELTSVLLVIAVVGAVLLASRPRPGEEIVDEGQAEREAQIEDRIVRAELRAEGYTREEMDQAAEDAEKTNGESDDAEPVPATQGGGS